jgi:F420-0:gamma-glutamyl ligase-like protein
MRDETGHPHKIYILKWIKVKDVLKPANEAQINLSIAGTCAGHPLNEMV